MVNIDHQQSCSRHGAWVRSHDYLFIMAAIDVYNEGLGQPFAPFGTLSPPVTAMPLTIPPTGQALTCP